MVKEIIIRIIRSIRLPIGRVLVILFMFHLIALTKSILHVESLCIKFVNIVLCIYAT